MKHLLKKSAVIAAALLSLGVANAAVIDFESIDTTDAPFAPLFGHNSQFYQGNAFINTQSNVAGAQPTDLTGALIDATDIANTCVDLTCPTNVTTGHFLAVFNDAYLVLGTLDGSPFTISTFSASAIGVPGDTFASNRAGQIVLQGNRANGTSTAVSGNLSLPNAQGAFSFANYNLASLWANEQFTSVFIYSRYCAAGQTTCTAFATDKGQFAIDNINVVAVPEPATWGLMGLGLAGIAALRRRRSV